MKRTILSFLFVVMMTLSLTACATDDTLPTTAPENNQDTGSDAVSEENNPLIGTWNLYDDDGEKTEVTFSSNQMAMLGMVKKYEISKDGTSITIFDNDDDTGRSEQFMITGDVLQLAGDTLYRSGSDAEKEFLDSIEEDKTE